ncbi:MAG: sigma 54-interacting transcriptional regulator, partial [Myxococcota bacterium]
EIKRVGTNSTRQIDVRVVAATNRDLSREVDAGRFREDLYFRLNVVRLEIPPLRERPDDIIYLTERFLADLPGINGPIALREDTKPKLTSYPWPGNVRELRNLVDRGAALSDRYFRLPEDFGRTLELDLNDDGRAVGSGVGLSDSPEASDSPARTAAPPVGSVTEPLWIGKSYKDAKEAVMADFEQGYLMNLLQAHGGNVSGAARAARIHRNILHRMMTRYGIKR